jgi:hypothetical protein
MAESLDIPLEIIADAGAAFRHRSHGDEVEREVIIDRGEDIYVGCELLPVIHGQFDVTSGPPMSLVIFDFQFQSNRSKRRFLEGHISVTSAMGKPLGDSKLDPVVRGISFASSEKTTQVHSWAEITARLVKA